MKQKRRVSMIGALILIISAVVLITGCPQPNSNQGNTGNNSGNISNNGGNGGNTGNNGGNTGNNSENTSNNGGNTGNNGGNTGNNGGNTGNNSENTSNNGGNTSNNSENTGNNGGNTGNNSGNEGQQEYPEESNPVIGVWQQQTGNRTVYWVFFETGEFCMAKYNPEGTLGIYYTRTAMGFYTVEDDYIKIPKGYIQFEKVTAGGNTFLNLANGKQTLLKVSSPSFDEIRDAPDTMPLP